MLGKRRYRRRIIIILCVVAALLLLIFLPGKIRTLRLAQRNRSSMHEREERARGMLEKAGVTVSDEGYRKLLDYDMELTKEIGEDYGADLGYDHYVVSYNNQFAAVLLVLAGAGNEDFTAWEPYSDDVFAVRKTASGEGLYAYVLQGIDHIAADVTFTDIEDDMSLFGVRHSVSFAVDGEKIRINETNAEGLFNGEFLDKVNEIIARHGGAHSLQTWDFFGNTIILYRDEADAQRVFNVANQYIKR